MKKDYITLGIITLVVLASIIYGFSVIGLPRDVRGAKYDDTRVSHLRNIKSQIQYFTDNEKRLPQTLSELKPKSSFIDIKDPETGKEYEYYITDSASYKLCAEFSTSSENSANYSSSMGYDSYYDEFKHPKGNHCFSFTIQTNQQNIYIRPTTNFYTPPSTPTLAPQAGSFEDKNVYIVRTSNIYNQLSSFPEGFFTEDPDDYGLVSDKPNSQTLVTVIFARPLKLAKITLLFDKCMQEKCSSWDAQATTDKNLSISLTNEIAIIKGKKEYSLDILTNELIKEIHFRVTPSFNFPGWNEEGKLYWSKMKFTYK